MMSSHENDDKKKTRKINESSPLQKNTFILIFCHKIPGKIAHVFQIPSKCAANIDLYDNF